MTLDERVADAIGIDRRVGREVALAEVARRYRPGMYESGRVYCDIPNEDGSVPPFPGGIIQCGGIRRKPDDPDERGAVLRLVGKFLADGWPLIAAEIEAYRTPPKAYSADWRALMEDVRPWVAAVPSRPCRFMEHLLRGMEPEMRAFMDTQGCGSDAEHIAAALTAGLLFATPEGWCNAVLATADEEKARV